MRYFLTVLFILSIGLSACSETLPPPPEKLANTEKIKAALQYLTIPNKDDPSPVEWIEYNPTFIVIGLKPATSYVMENITRGVAEDASKAAGYSVDVWAVPDNLRNWKEKDEAYGIVTAENGRIRYDGFKSK